ncbi:MAG: hypothetical protein WBH31_13250 [Promethearchaeia archaeon]
MTDKEVFVKLLKDLKDLLNKSEHAQRRTRHRDNWDLVVRQYELFLRLEDKDKLFRDLNQILNDMIEHLKSKEELYQKKKKNINIPISSIYFLLHFDCISI